MSGYRHEKFKQCANDHDEERGQAGVRNVTYASKMTHAQMRQLATWLQDSGRATAAKDVMDREVMQTLSVVLCRWPRPSELAVLAGLLPGNSKGLNYFGVTVELEQDQDLSASTAHRARSKLVGPMGANFNRIGDELGLMYI